MSLQNNQTVKQHKQGVQILINRNLDIYLQYKGIHEIKMQPLIKTVYLFFLQHPEGVSFYDLSMHKSEITKLYGKVICRTSSTHAYINRLVNRQDNSINEKISRIKKLFSRILPEHLLEQVIIKGERRQAKQISLDRSQVIWEK